jgi:hypothetical protein
MSTGFDNTTSSSKNKGIVTKRIHSKSKSSKAVIRQRHTLKNFQTTSESKKTPRTNKLDNSKEKHLFPVRKSLSSTFEHSASIHKSYTLKRKSNEESSIVHSSMSSTQEQERRPLKKPTIPSMKEKPFDDNQDKDDVNNPDEEDIDEDIDDDVEVTIGEMLHLFSTSDVPDNDTTRRQRIAFNILAFGYREHLDIFPEPSRTSKQFTDEKFNNTMMLMQKLTISDNATTKKKALKESRTHYKKMGQFVLEEITLGNGGETKLVLCRNPSLLKPLRWGPRGNIVLPMRQMFDVLYAAHERVGHMKVISTYKNLQKIIWNVTQAQSKIFCSLCPNCILQSPRIKKLRGASKPIRSSKFRDRFQVDLVDMSANRRKNIYGIVMRYILVIKDHFSGFVIADCIPRKRAKYVAYILNQYFSCGPIAALKLMEVFDVEGASYPRDEVKKGRYRYLLQESYRNVLRICDESDGNNSKSVADDTSQSSRFNIETTENDCITKEITVGEEKEAVKNDKEEIDKAYDNEKEKDNEPLDDDNDEAHDNEKLNEPSNDNEKDNEPLDDDNDEAYDNEKLKEPSNDKEKDNEPSNDKEKDNEPLDDDNDEAYDNEKLKEPSNDKEKDNEPLDVSAGEDQFWDDSAMLLLGRMSPKGSIITPSESKTIFRKKMMDKMKKDREHDIQHKAAVVGSKVNVKIDKRDVTGAQGIHGIVFDVGSGGGIRVQTQHGIITQKSGKKWYIPKAQYEVLDDYAPVNEWLHNEGLLIKKGMWEESEGLRRATLKEIHGKLYGGEPIRGCKCRTGNCKNCVCSRARNGCSETCKCLGQCCNPFNDK